MLLYVAFSASFWLSSILCVSDVSRRSAHLPSSTVFREAVCFAKNLLLKALLVYLRARDNQSPGTSSGLQPETRCVRSHFSVKVVCRFFSFLGKLHNCSELPHQVYRRLPGGREQRNRFSDQSRSVRKE